LKTQEKLRKVRISTGLLLGFDTEKTEIKIIFVLTFRRGAGTSIAHDAAPVVHTHADYKRSFERVIAIIILQRTWHKIKKSSGYIRKHINYFLADIRLKSLRQCRNCKHSESSKNNGNLLCLNDRSRYFGAAVSPKKDMNCFLYANKEKRSKSDNSAT